MLRYMLKMAGARAKVEKFEVGVSGKTNAIWSNGVDQNRKLACIFGDSMIRALMQRNHVQKWPFINVIISCTPGATCAHLEKEIQSFIYPKRPDVIILQVGTNNIKKRDWQRALAESRDQFRRLVKRSKDVCDVSTFTIYL
ncbi:uncharacterized protein LOC121427439 [Lytechinus variegatus]|uniref:uncharacterized protein LOC121427439 n=1 Tax=Lytechinus variegatus TaxID=7654 RepID=UPI001BB13457|nr:uncharacterized protein LOC121427439 [Lytechinus variegatus]